MISIRTYQTDLCRDWFLIVIRLMWSLLQVFVCGMSVINKFWVHFRAIKSVYVTNYHFSVIIHIQSSLLSQNVSVIRTIQLMSVTNCFFLIQMFWLTNSNVLTDVFKFLRNYYTSQRNNWHRSVKWKLISWKGINCLTFSMLHKLLGLI